MLHTNPSRRLVPWMLVLAAAILQGCASSLPRAEQPLEVIDAHVHTNFDDKFYDIGKVMHSKEELAAEMKRSHVVGAVSMNHAGDDYVDLSDLNVINCAGLGTTVDAVALEAGLASKKYRCIKIYLGYKHQYAYDPAYEPAYRLAEIYHVPVVFHTGDTDSQRAKLKYAAPLTVDEVADQRDHSRPFALGSLKRREVLLANWSERSEENARRAKCQATAFEIRHRPDRHAAGEPARRTAFDH